MKQSFLKLLTGLLLLSTLATGCASGGFDDTVGQTQNPNSAGNADTTADTTAQAFDPFDGLPEKKYDGYEFSTLVRPLERWMSDMCADEYTGDVVNDAVFERNSLVQEKYNITMTYQTSSHSNYDTDAVSTILAGDDAYDLIIPHGRAAFEYANQGLLLDWNTQLPYIKLGSAWWNQDARHSLSINNKLYVMIGDISHNCLSAANVMLFNKKMFNDLSFSYPYQTVLDGKWTFEAWKTLVNAGSADLNGDGRIDSENDRFGYVTQKWIGPVQAFATSGLRILSKDADDIPYVSMYSEKTIEVFNRYFDLIESDQSYVDTGDVSYSSGFINIFAEGRSLFIDMNMADVITLRTMETDFGVIPWPKYDENADYCTNVDAGTNMLVVPITSSDPERTSIILEALCAIGSEKVIPAYYDVTLQTKASRDNESAAMLDIIKGACIFDLGYYNEKAAGAYSNEFVNFIDNPGLGRDFASWYDKNLKAVTAGMEKIVENYMK